MLTTLFRVGLYAGYCEFSTRSGVDRFRMALYSLSTTRLLLEDCGPPTMMPVGMEPDSELSTVSISSKDEAS
jgi:hypothetical protein